VCRQARCSGYDYPEKYTTPGRIVEARSCCRQPALKRVRVPLRLHLGTAVSRPMSAIG